MSAGAQHIDMALIYIDRHLAECLDCIRVEQYVVFVGNPADFLDWLNRSYLIVRVHD